MATIDENTLRVVREKLDSAQKLIGRVIDQTGDPDGELDAAIDDILSARDRVRRVGHNSHFDLPGVSDDE